jgi:hypothetical protein
LSLRFYPPRFLFFHVFILCIMFNYKWITVKHVLFFKFEIKCIFVLELRNHFITFKAFKVWVC